MLLSHNCDRRQPFRTTLYVVLSSVLVLGFAFSQLCSLSCALSGMPLSAVLRGDDAAALSGQIDSRLRHDCCHRKKAAGQQQDRKKPPICPNAMDEVALISPVSKAVSVPLASSADPAFGAGFPVLTLADRPHSLEVPESFAPLLRPPPLCTSLRI